MCSFRISLRVLFALTSFFIISCSNSKQVTKRSNPWQDDYRDKSAMTSYASWGTYNVHDPSCLLVGDTYYMYSTDAILGEDSIAIKKNKLPFGYIQLRKSKDLVHWEYVGWALDEIPAEMKSWVLTHAHQKGATNIWAPYLLKYKDKFRLYFSVSAFGRQTSCIGFAESTKPDGPWDYKGIVVKTKQGDAMNAIDPSIVTDPQTGEQWMHYGSFFGGLYAVKLNAETGFVQKNGDQGQLIARRFDGKKNNIEAPEIIYNPTLKKYFLFVSYDPLMTTYNIRVGRSESANGPFLDYNGKNLSEEIEHFPILTYPYAFEKHAGWSGTGHCSVFSDASGQYFMAHQARLAPENHQMVLHVRQIFWNSDGWPVLSPERYNGDQNAKLKAKDIIGTWETILIKGQVPDRNLEAGQILWGENKLQKDEMNLAQKIIFHKDQTFTGTYQGTWSLSKNSLTLHTAANEIQLKVFEGQDWENEQKTILFSGLDQQGFSFWGKRIK
ncbi:arabinan endo-1,5-alpha-L-arabinosidase [Sphingobacterium sp. LRF_L2]|uniref:arabinan endo-1,5-alpha-L-arabinosidase n=1 Tax=Sphingobacterium sp. LRF_L2 TaxID=3369421 RepID=UPI003F605808